MLRTFTKITAAAFALNGLAPAIALSDGNLDLTTITATSGAEAISVGAGIFYFESDFSDVIYIDGNGDLRRLVTTTGGSDYASTEELLDDTKSHTALWVGDVNNDGLSDIVTISTPPSGGFVSQINVIPSLNAADQGNQIFGSMKSFTPPLASPSTTNFLTVDDIDLGMMARGAEPFNIIFHATNVTSSTAPAEGEDPPATTYGNQGYVGVASVNTDTNEISLSSQGLVETGAVRTGTDITIFKAFFSGRVAAGDFNNDGMTDVAFCYANGGTYSPQSFIFPGDNGEGVSIDSDNAVDLGVLGCRDGGALRVVDVVADTQQYNKHAAGNPYFSNGSSSGSEDGSARYFLVENNDSRVFAYNPDWSVVDDYRIQNTQLAELGTFADFDGDNSTDWMFLDGKNSKIVIGWDWSNSDGGKQPSSDDITMGNAMNTGDWGNFGTSNADFVTLNKDNEVIILLNNTLAD